MSIERRHLTRIASRLVLVVAAVVLCAGCTSRDSINLLKAVDPSTDAVNGNWRIVSKRLESDVTEYARIAMPVIPHGDYELNVRFVRLIGEDSVNFVLPVADRQVLLTLGGWPEQGGISGLELIDGQTARNNITADRAFQVVNHHVYELRVLVRTSDDDASIDVDLDRRPFIRWRGKQAALSLPRNWGLSGESRLGVGAYNSVVQIQSARLRMIPGTMKRTTPADAADSK